MMQLPSSGLAPSPISSPRRNKLPLLEMSLHHTNPSAGPSPATVMCSPPLASAPTLAPPLRTWASGASGAVPRRACRFRPNTCRFHSGMGRPRSSRVGTSPSRSPKGIPSSCSATRLSGAPPAAVSAPCVHAGRSLEEARRSLQSRSERRGGLAQRSTAAGGGAWGLTREDRGPDHYRTPSLFKSEASSARAPSPCRTLVCVCRLTG